MVDEEFLGLKLGNSTIEVEVCWEFFSVSVDTVPQIHISKQWKINLIMIFWLSKTWDSLSVYTINTLASKHCIFSVTKKNATNFWMSVSEKKIIIMLYKVFVFWELEFFHQKYYKMYKNWILISGKKNIKNTPTIYLECNSVSSSNL